MKTLKAVNDHIIGEIIKEDKMTDSGIIIPENVNPPYKYVKVISVGEEVKTISPDDLIICHSNGGQDIMFDDKIMKVLKLPEVYGIVIDKK